jgi:uncharacterized protein (UPF0147 family)
MNLALCSELNEELYLKVFETLSNLPEISLADLRLTHQMITSTARLVSSRREKRTRRTTLVYDDKKYKNLLNSCKILQDLTKAATEDSVLSMYLVVELLLPLCKENTFNREDTELFLELLENICSEKRLQKVSRQYLKIILTALNYSNLVQSDQAIALLEDIKNNDKLSTHHENFVIKLDKGVIVTEGPGYKYLFTFKHPGTRTCSDVDSKCGFILKGSIQDGYWTETLCTNSEDYTNTGIHLHDIISAHEMYMYGAWSGITPHGNEVRVVGRWGWWCKWLSYITNWKFKQDCVAYNIMDYLVAKPE